MSMLSGFGASVTSPVSFAAAIFAASSRSTSVCTATHAVKHPRSPSTKFGLSWSNRFISCVPAIGASIPTIILLPSFGVGGIGAAAAAGASSSAASTALSPSASASAAASPSSSSSSSHSISPHSHPL